MCCIDSNYLMKIIFIATLDKFSQSSAGMALAGYNDGSLPFGICSTLRIDIG